MSDVSFNRRRLTNRMHSSSGQVAFSQRAHRPDYRLILFMSLLLLVGLIMLYAIGPQRANVLNDAYGTDYSDSYFFLHQLLNIGVAMAVFFGASFIPTNTLFRHRKALLLAGIIACLVLFIASKLHLGIAQYSLGATRWFNLGPLSFQPAELLKLGILVYLAAFLGHRMEQKKVNDNKKTLIPVAIITAIAAILVIVFQKDFGTGAALLVMIMVMLVMAGVKVRTLVQIGLAVVLVSVVLVFTSPHRVQRIETYLNGDNTSTQDSSDSNYHIEQAKTAIGSGGLLGLGVGNSVQATGYLPEAINDSIFAIIGETFGFVGLVVILALFSALLMRLLQIMDHTIDSGTRVLVAGVFGWLAAHVLLNVGAMIGIIPLTGITLPFLSYGGTSLLAISAALGLVFRASRYTVYGSRMKEVLHSENSGSRRRIRRARYAGRGRI